MKKIFAIWICLIVLLVGGTYVSYLPFSKIGAAFLILGIALVKAVLVTLFYMHLKGERLPVWIVVVFPFFLLALAVSLILIGTLTS